MSGPDFISASTRLLRDARLMSDNSRFDSSSHLAGFSVECSLKAVVQAAGVNARRYRHKLLDLQGPALDLALLTSPWLIRYQASPGDVQVVRDRWTENGRYDKTGTTTPEQCSTILGATRRIWTATKGGVGRTTALAALAYYLAEEKDLNVVVLDLDLEAPGAGPLLLNAAGTDLGLVDYLLEERVQPGELPLSRFYNNCPALSGAGSVRVFPAGTLNDTFLEKLGRLDVQGLVDPATDARTLLLGLCQRIREELRPDAILIDSRAGFHDLGGISLSGLAHYELIFGIHSEQTWPGLNLVLGHLGRLRADWCRLVHTMVPPRTRGGDELHSDFVSRAYTVCCEVYYKDGEIPDPNDSQACHAALRLPFREGLMALSGLSVARIELLSDEHRLFCEQVAKEVGLVS